MTRRAFAIALAIFGAVFGAHVWFHLWRDQQAMAHWVSVPGRVQFSPWRQYLDRQDYWVGYSYALAAAFTAYALTLSLERRRAMGSVAGGVTMLGVLYAGGCFLIGCCGSPMLGIYLSLFGAKILGLVKPLMAVITTASVLVSGILLVRRTRAACCEACARPEGMAATPAVK